MVLTQLWVDYGTKDPGLTEIPQLAGKLLQENQLLLTALQFTVLQHLIVLTYGIILVLVIG